MKNWTRSRLTAVAVMALAAATFDAGQAAAPAGDFTEQAAEAERQLDAGEPNKALAAFDDALAAFWRQSPLTTRVAVFANKADGFANYAPRPDAVFRPADTLLVYLEPFGPTYARTGEGFRAAVAVDVEIIAGGDLILAEAPDFGRLEWSGRERLYQLDATISLPLPDLKPGDYELVITLRDLGSTKTATVALPFSIAG